MSANRHKGKNESSMMSGPKATCTQMCPDQEFNMRVKNNLVNKLEKTFINSKVNYQLVKEYSRPAAGKEVKPSELRTLETLINTTIFLVDEVHERDDVHYIQVYEYLFDRFRAIRQDLVIQRLDNIDAIQILEVILRFYILSDYKLCLNKDYDEYMNYQHLSEVLFTIITSMKPENLGIYCTIYMLLNLENKLNLSVQILKLAKSLKKEYYPMNNCLRLITFYTQKNYVSMFRALKKLPLICQMAFHRRIPAIQKAMIAEYNVAYSWKNTKFPVDKFIELASMNSRHSLQKFVDNKMITIDADDNIIFQKKNSTNEPNKKLNERERLNQIDQLLREKPEKDILLKSFEVRRLSIDQLKINDDTCSGEESW